MRLDDEAVALAYQRYGHLVYLRCQAILKAECDARDAVQDVFVKLLKFGKHFQDATSPVHWLNRVAERVCFDILRRRRPEGGNEPIEADMLPSCQNPAKEASDREILLLFLCRFDDRVKRLVLMYYLDGLTQDEIASELGWSRITIMKKLAFLSERTNALRTILGVN